MKKKKLTNKEISTAIFSLTDHNKALWDRIEQTRLDIDKFFSLYLEYKKELKNFNNFVKVKQEEFEKKQRSENKK